MPKLYTHGHIKDKSSNKRWWVFFLGAILLIASVWLYVYIDTSQSKVIDDSENRAITSEYKVEKTEARAIDEPTYTMEVPLGWIETDRYLDNGRLFVEYRGPKGTMEHGRKVEIYSGGLPRDPSSTRLVEISNKNGSELKVGRISDRCHTFTDSLEQVATPEPELAKWNNIEFMCNFSAAMNTISAGSVNDGQLILLNGEITSNSYFFRYSDQNTTTNFDIFKDILESFEAK